MPYFSESSGSYKETLNNKEIANLGYLTQTDGTKILLKLRDGNKTSSIEDSLKEMLCKSKNNTKKRKKRKHNDKKANVSRKDKKDKEKDKKDKDKGRDKKDKKSKDK